MSKKKPSKKKKQAKKKKLQEKRAAKKKETASKYPDSVISLPDRRAMEGTFANIFGHGKPNAVGRAQKIMYNAWDADDPEERIALALEALEVSRDCADAYVLLAEEEADSLEEAIDFYRQGVEAGERALGKEAFNEDAGHFWGVLETRPYMRARAGLAQGLWEAGYRDEAVEHYKDMLRLNPNDNQGIRDLLMPCLIKLGRDEDAQVLLKQYEDDIMADWSYSRALLDFRKHGDGPVANKSLKEAVERNKHVPKYLFGHKRMPRHLPEYSSFGDVNEAVHYVHENKAAWEATPGALKWLATQLK
ncbi:MAG: tetratricopeptide repeat protein [Nitrospinota bacterium]